MYGLERRVANRARPNRSENHIRQADVGGEIRRSVDLRRHVEPRQVLSRKAILPGWHHWQRRRKIVARRFAGQLGKEEFLVAQPHNDDPRTASFPIHIPQPPPPPTHTPPPPPP